MAPKFKFLYTTGSQQDSTKVFLNPLDFTLKHFYREEKMCKQRVQPSNGFVAITFNKLPWTFSEQMV
jgi:hypothetical protein